MLPAPFCSTLLSLQLGKNLTKIFTMREKKNEIVEKQLFSVFSFFFFCLSAFLFFFFLPFIWFFFFCSFFDLYLRELSPMMSNKQTNKKIQSYQLALHSLKERFWGMEWRVIVQTVGWTQKGGIGGGGRRSIKFMRGWKFKKFKKTEDGCAADGA